MSMEGLTYGDFAYGDFDGDSLSIADVLKTLLEQPDLPRSWWFRGRPRDTIFDLYVKFGTGEHADFGNVLDQTTNDFSIQIRAKDENALVLCGKRSNLLLTGFYIGLRSTGKVFVNLSDGVDDVELEAESVITKNFSTYTAVIDRAADELLLYRDGALQGSATDIAFIGSLSNSDNLFIGRLTNLASTGCDVDEFRFWSKALSAIEVENNYDAELDVSSLPANLELYCRMNDSDGAVLTDETVNGYDGTLTGGEYLPTTVGIDLSTDGHRTYPTDDEETQFPEALIVPYSQSYGLTNELYGQVDTDLGEIVIDDAALNRRSIAIYDWYGRQADVYIGPRLGTQNQFTRVGELLSRAIRYDRSKLSVIVDGHGFLFDRPLHSNFYDGTGGLEGDTEISGQPKPMWVGVKRQVEPKLVDAANLIYQLHDGTLGAMSSVDAVRDKGVDKAFDADVADITTATPAVGEYATSLANGYIKLGDKNGKITCDAQGWVFPTYGYVDDISGIVRGLAIDVAGFDDPANLDPAAFSDLSSAFTHAMGNYFDKPITIREAIDTFHRSAMSWGWLKPNKVLTAGRIVDPDSIIIDVNFTLDKSREEVNLIPFSVDPFEIPVGRVFVGYRRYPSTMSDADLDASISAAVRLDYAQSYRFAQAEDSEIFIRTPDAQEIFIFTDLDTEVGAQAIADEQLALRKVHNRRLVKVSSRTGLISRGIGQTFILTDDCLPDSPKNMTIIGVMNKAAIDGTSDKIEFTCIA